ncbi:MAG: DoxX family protein [Patescibacteria group bacterium]
MRTQSQLGKIAETTHEKSFGVAYVALRVLLGGVYLTAGWSKISVGGWSAATYLATAEGPFSEWFRSLAGNSAIDFVNEWGLLCLGIALIVGLLVRPAAILGIVLMALYYVAHFVSNTAMGYIDEHIIYSAVLALFAAGGAGHAFGLNAIVLGNIRKPNAVVKFLFG